MDKKDNLKDNLKDKPKEPIKERISRCWSLRAKGFETRRLREYESEKRERWLAEFRKYLPAGRKLRILDVGTGFFDRSREAG